jgi:hypothetical protein
MAERALRVGGTENIFFCIMAILFLPSPDFQNIDPPSPSPPGESVLPPYTHKRSVFLRDIKNFNFDRTCIHFFSAYHSGRPTYLRNQCWEPEPRADKPKLNCLPEPKLRIAAPAHFYLPQT